MNGAWLSYDKVISKFHVIFVFFFCGPLVWRFENPIGPNGVFFALPILGTIAKSGSLGDHTIVAICWPLDHTNFDLNWKPICERQKMEA